MSQFTGFGVEVELKDGKVISGKVAKANSKSLTLSDVVFSDGGVSQVFKVKASRLRDLKVVSTPRKENRKKQNNPSPPQGDWQDDDAAQIKQQTDFDFEGNLRMFNKQDVFAQLRAQDETEVSDRLVSHNKRERDPESKLQPDELVLPNAKQDNWDNLEEESAQSEYLPITKSINITHLLQGAAANNKAESNGAAVEDHVLSQLQKALSRTGSVSRPAEFTVEGTKSPVPCATPVQLLEIERLCAERFCFSPKLSLEHWAVHMSRFVKQRLGGRVRLHACNTNPEPLVVVLAGDNRCGTRGVALARLLCQSSLVRTIALFTNEPEDSELRDQVALFQLCGGKVVDSVSGLNAMLDKLNSPVEIVIDAMQGFDCSLQDLCSASGDERRVDKMIRWCNEQQSVYSLDIPSGYDAGSALPAFPVQVKPSMVISMCWPLAGLFNYVSQQPENSIELYLVDVGVPQAVYAQRSALRKFQIPDLFTTEGVIQLE
ncbi:LAMI_0H07140g1_1 [Lachancea mirantina]|uniref:Enhancer of mRNA-decapping protein 3 n=1 Tax=Lachancea mirantina TaxID=1230905 RepID=A0A1G4KG38_9SACH|nr:LAMI_0H07140g1_1 [Lachancea mirantina]